MNNERYNQIIDEAYKNYAYSHWTPPENPNSKLLAPQLWSLIPMQHNKESFIHEIKTNPEFSEKWGLKIEERELTTVEERQKYDKFYDYLFGEYPEHHKTLDNRGVPRKIITVTYKDEKIKIYE
jgi:hypothetical protein